MTPALVRSGAATAALAWGAALLALAAWGWLRCGGAAARDDEAALQMRALAHDLDRLQALRAQSQVVARGRRPDADLVTRAQRALADAGLPVAACSGVQPRADQVAAGSGVRVQTVQLTLRGLRPGELGSWLAAWTAGDQPWRVDELQLAHQAAPGAVPAAATGLDSNRFDVSVVLAAPYLEESP